MLCNCNFIRSRTLLICLSLMAAGLSAGLFSAASMSPGDKLRLSGVLGACRDAAAGTAGSCWPVLALNISLLLAIFICGLTIYGFPVAQALLLCRSFAAGFCGSLLLYKTNDTGTANVIFSFFIPHIFLCTVYLAAAAAAADYALPQLHKNGSRSAKSAHSGGVNPYSDVKRCYFVLYIALSFLTIVISILI